jgi:hypothetical protein
MGAVGQARDMGSSGAGERKIDPRFHHPSPGTQRRPTCAADGGSGPDPRSPMPSTWRRLIRPLLIEPWLLDGLSWRLVGLTVLVAIPIHPDIPIRAALVGNWGASIYWVLGSALDGLLVLLFGVVLSNLRQRALARSLALALAVVLGSTLASALFALPWGLGLLDLSDSSTGSYVGDVLWYSRKAALPWAFIAAAWYFTERISERTAALRDAELARHQIEARIVEAHLQVLQAQTEPHFLFNTLAHVKRLYRTDPALGRKMLDRFCDYLHAALPQMRGDDATLGRELDLARAYLDVQKIRMGRRLVVDIDVPADIRGMTFPPMMLVSVVENAIKHGLSPLPEGGGIAISAMAHEHTLQVTVADTGRGFSTTKGTGVGLSNIRARLESMYGTAGRLALTPNSPRGIVAAIMVPVVAAPARRLQPQELAT